MSKAQPRLMHQTAEQATSELGDVNDLVNSQVAAGMSRDEVVEALYVSWADRLARLSTCSQNDKAAITNALASGPWSDAQRKELARTILVGSRGAIASKKRPNQKCIYLENFVPQDVWVKLKDPTQYSQLTRASLLAGVAHSIGIECPDQPTLYRMVSILAYCEKNYEMAQDEVHKLMDKIQSFIKGQPRTADVPYIDHYPCAAKELPSILVKRAYGSGDLPVEVDIPELGIILGDSKMRGRPKNNLPDWLEHVPDNYKGLVIQQMSATKRSRSSSSHDMLQASGSNLQQFYPMPSAHLLRGATMPAQPPRRLTEGIDGPPTKAEHADTEVKKEPNDSEADGRAGPPTRAELAALGVEELEEQLLTGMLKNGKRKKLAVKRVSKDKTTAGKVKVRVNVKATRKVEPTGGAGMKKPAAAEASHSKAKKAAGMKKPAAAAASHGKPVANNIDIAGLFAKLRVRKASMTRKQFVSMAYHHAQQMAKSAGFGEDEAKAIARDAHGKASRMYG